MKYEIALNIGGVAGRAFSGRLLRHSRKGNEMAKYTIITDSCCDLPADLAEKIGIDVVPLTVTIGGVNYSNFLDGSDISFNQFYSRLGGGDIITTSAVNSETFRTVFESELMLGRDVLYIGFSSALSATVAVFFARSTFALLTPSIALSAFSTLA